MVAVEMLFLRVLGGMVSSLTMGDDIEIWMLDMWGHSR